MGKKLLLIDDDIDFINIYQKIFEHEGYKIEIGYNSEDGYKKALEFNPDLIILDIMMETPNAGFELAKRFKDEKKDYNIILSSSIAKASSELYDTDYLNIKQIYQKSADFSKLVNLVKKFIKD